MATERTVLCQEKPKAKPGLVMPILRAKRSQPRAWQKDLLQCQFLAVGTCLGLGSDSAIPALLRDTSVEGDPPASPSSLLSADSMISVPQPS